MGPPYQSKTWWQEEKLPSEILDEVGIHAARKDARQCGKRGFCTQDHETPDQGRDEEFVLSNLTAGQGRMGAGFQESREQIGFLAAVQIG